MSDIKELTVQLQPLDAKVLIPGAKTRRRNKKMEGGSHLDKTSDAMPPTSSAPAPVPAVAPLPPSLPEPLPSSSSMAPADVPLPVTPVATAATATTATTAATATTGGGTVKIKEKRNAPPAVGAKFLPKKRALSTVKKPKLVVCSPAHTKKSNVDGGSKTRRFSERSISIEMKPVSATRKHRKDLGKKIGSMTPAAIRKFLLRRGVLKPKTSMSLPEPMLRSMLKDYLLLHTAE
jgi:hypothetical protein